MATGVGETQELVLSCKSKAKILSWSVKKGDTVKKDSVLATYIFTEKVADANNFIVNRKLKAKCTGSVKELLVEANQEIQRGQVVARLQESQCTHNTVMKDMCVDCGADLRREPGIPGQLSEPATASVPVVHNILELKVSVEEALRLARYDEEQLLKARKLVLVVDLDMTLIHTTVQPVPKGTKDVFSFTLPGHQYEYHTKLRPNARKFLESIGKFFELHIFTMGSRMYAHTVAKCLDPDGKFFAHRIRSRDEFINSFSKFHDLKALFPCGDHMVCIIDDREDVWSYAPNLIVVKPYKVFKGADDINDPFKPELTLSDSVGPNSKQPATITSTDEESKEGETKEGTSEEGGEKNDTNKEIGSNEVKDGSSSDSSTDVVEKLKEVDSQKAFRPFLGDAKDLDDYLFYLDEVLERIHFYFYSTLDAVKTKGGTCRTDPSITRFCTVNTLNPDVRVIVPETRRMTLKGCNLVFTGVVPTNVPLEKSKPWRTAIGLGARVTNNIVPKSSTDGGLGTTHVVAARHGTKKAFEASRNPEIHLVNPSWLWCAGERWERPDECLFPVPLSDEKNGKSSPVSSRQGTPLGGSEQEQKSKTKQISPLAKDFEVVGGPYDPANFLKEPISVPNFSKQELEAMDKEVEDLMQSGSDGETDSECAAVVPESVAVTEDNTTKPIEMIEPNRKRKSDCELGSVVGKKPKKLSRSSSKNSSNRSSREQSSDSSSNDSSDDSNDEDEDEDGDQDDSDDEKSSDSGSSSSSSDDDENDSDSSSDEEKSMANMLERRISECSDSS